MRVAETRAVNRRCERSTALGFAQSKRSRPFQNLHEDPTKGRGFLRKPPMQTVRCVRSAIACAKSFVSISSIRT
jgi:hypothetical protein